MAKHVVLYVEDNKANMVLISKVLDMLDDVEMHGAETGEAGFRLAQEIRPNLVLLDINLPDMSGLDVLKKIRAEPSIQGVPVIALTASASRGEVSEGLEAGCDSYLTKPFDVRQFLDVINQYLGVAPAGESAN